MNTMKLNTSPPHTTAHVQCVHKNNGRHWSMSPGQYNKLTLPFSWTRMSMTITAGLWSQIICQKSEMVVGVGPGGRAEWIKYTASLLVTLMWGRFIKQFRYVLHASKGGGKGRAQVLVCARCKCLSMYIHTIYTYAVYMWVECECIHCGCAPLYITLCSKTVTLVDTSVPSQACVYIHVHVRTLRGNVCTLLHVALHLEKQ